jgi:hypothetical protein
MTHGISLLDFMYKFLTKILNIHIRVALSFYWFSTKIATTTNWQTPEIKVPLIEQERVGLENDAVRLTKLNKISNTVDDDDDQAMSKILFYVQPVKI